MTGNNMYSMLHTLHAVAQYNTKKEAVGQFWPMWLPPHQAKDVLR